MRPDFTQQTVSLYAVPFPRRTKFTFAPQLSKPSPQIPYEAISIFDPPPTIERVRFEYTASLREKNEAQLLRESCHSFNQPVNVKKSYRSGFTLAVNRKRNLERKSIWIRVFARRFFFFTCRIARERSNVSPLLCFTIVRGSSAVVVKPGWALLAQ